MKTLPISNAPMVMRAALLPARRVTVHGTQANALAVEHAAQAAGENRTVVFLAGDNRFDPYAVARYALRQGWQPAAVLQRILIARAFTAYQLVELLARLMPADITGPVIVSGICSAFFDEDLSHTEAARLFYRTLWRTLELSQQGVTLLLVECATTDRTRRGHFLTDLARASHATVHLSGASTCTLEQRPQHTRPYLPAAPEVV